MSNHFNQVKTRQSGVALITGLIFMVVMTILVIGALRSATLEERMAANAHNRLVALQSAEAVLRHVESNEFTQPQYMNFSGGNFSDASGCTRCSVPVAGAAPRWQTMTDQQWGEAPRLAVNLEGVTEPHNYIIEVIWFPRKRFTACSKGLARTTVRSQGQGSGTVFLQSVYRFEVATC